MEVKPESEQREQIEIHSEQFGITLREFGQESIGEIFSLIDRNRDHLSQFGDDTARKYKTPKSVERSITHQKNPARLRFGIWNRENELVGSINLTPDKDNPKRGEIGYYLGGEFVGKGYMRKSLLTLCDYALNKLGYEELYGEVSKDNLRSANVLVKAGFKQTEIKAKTIIYSLLKG